MLGLKYLVASFSVVTEQWQHGGMPLRFYTDDRSKIMSKKELEVVPPLPRNIAKKAFEQWRFANRKIANRLSAEDIIIDWIRAKEGKTVVRYRVAL